MQKTVEAMLTTDLQSIDTIPQELVTGLPMEIIDQAVGPSLGDVVVTEGEVRIKPRETGAEQTTNVRRSERSNKGKPPERYGFCENLQEPVDWEEISKLPILEREKWIEAMEEEFQSLQQNHLWTLTELPPNR